MDIGIGAAIDGATKLPAPPNPPIMVVGAAIGMDIGIGARPTRPRRRATRPRR